MRAFVDVVAKLRLDATNDLEAGVRRQARAAERDLQRLENVSDEVAARMAAAFRDLDVHLDVRQALGSLQRLGREAEQALGGLRGAGLGLDVDSGDFNRRVGQLQAALTRLAQTFDRVDDNVLDLDVGESLRAVDSVERQIRRLVGLVDSLADERVDLDFSGALGDVRNLETRLGTLRRDLQSLDLEGVTIRVDDLGLESLERQLDALQLDVRELSGSRIVFNTEAGEAALRELQAEARRTNATLNLLENHGVDVGRQIRGLAVRAGAFFVANEAAEGLRQLISLGVQAAAEIERTEVALRQLFRGLEAEGQSLGVTADQFLRDLQELAITTPFEFADLGDISRRLVTLGGDADTVEGRMRDLADATAAFGGTSDDINGVVRAITQLASKGKVDLQDFRQISERLPSFTRQLQVQGIIDELNELRPGLNATASDFNELRKSGALTTDVIVNGLFRGLREIPGAAGAAAAQARTLSGALSNLRDFATIQFADSFSGVGEALGGELQAAFSEVSSGDADSGLAGAIKEVIDAAGDATEDALGDVFGFVEDLSDEVVDALGAVGDLVGSFSSGFAGDALEGMIDGVTSLVTLLRLANDVLSLLPAGVSRSVTQFVTLAAVLPGVSTPFKNLAQDLGNELAPSTFMAREGFESLGKSVATAGAAAVGLVALQVALNSMAKAAQRAREFSQSIDDASDSLQEFTDVGDAVLDFLAKFEEEGEGVNIGGLETTLDGLTTPDIATQLGISRDALGRLITELGRVPGNPFAGYLEDLEAVGTDRNAARAVQDTGVVVGEAAEAFAAAGVPLSVLDGLSEDAIASIASLSAQFRLGAEDALALALAEERFSHVSQGTVNRVTAAANRTGDYVTAMEELTAAEERAMQAEFGRLAAVEGLSATQRTAILEQTENEDGTRNYTAAVAELQEQLAGLDQSLQDVLIDNPGVRLAFEGIASGAVGAAGALFDLAFAVQGAGLDAQELDALARGLGSTLEGEAFGEALAGVVEDFQDAMDLVADSLPGMVDAFDAAMDRVSVPEELPEGVDELQFKLDHFSVRAFIQELDKIAVAQGELLVNLQTIADISPAAARDLLELELDPAALALVAQELADGGASAVEAFAAPFRASDFLMQTLGADLARTLVEAGIDPALIASVPALAGAVEGLLVEGAGAGATAAAARVEEAVRPFNEAIGRLLTNFDPNSALDEAQLIGLIGARGEAGAGAAGAAATTPAAAGAEAAAAVSRGFEAALDLATPTLQGANDAAAALVDSTIELELEAAGLAASIAESFGEGLALDSQAWLAVSEAAAVLGDALLPALAYQFGFSVGGSFGSGIVAGLAQYAQAIAAAAVPAPGVPRAPRLPKLPGFADGLVAWSPTAGVFGEAGPEALIPLSRPGRALDLMEETGLADLALRAAGGSSAAEAELAYQSTELRRQTRTLKVIADAVTSGRRRGDPSKGGW